MKKLLHLFTAAIILLTISWAPVMGQTSIGVPYFSIINPASISEIFAYEDGIYTTSRFSNWGGDVTNDLIVANVKIADLGTDSLLCDSLNTTDFSGKIALIRRGACEFGAKALNAELKGALAVIIINHTQTNNGNPVNMGAGSVGSMVTVPVIMVSNALGEVMMQTILSGQEVSVSLGEAPFGFTKLEGFVKIDDNNNCMADGSELPAGTTKIGVEFANGNFVVRNVGEDGHYATYVNPANAPFEITCITGNTVWLPCPAVVNVSTSTPDTLTNNFALGKSVDCTQLEAEITAPFLRRCFENYFTVEVCNLGTITATNAYAQVQLAPEFGPIHDETLPYTIVGPGLYQFDLGDIEPFECVDIQFQSIISCDSTVLGQTLCYSVHAFPDTDCDQPDPLWDGSNIVISGNCENGQPVFTITNTGAAMTTSSEYIVIQDDVMYMQTPFQLGAGASQSVSLPGNGATWRLEAGQIPHHPLPGNPARSLEGCATGTSFTTGYSMMFPIYDLGAAIDEECQEIIGSYDPNDKQGFPLGFTTARLIRPEVDLDYLIRFQNTGTDTAFTVVVRDTLPAALDPRSVRDIVASHDYSLEITANHVMIFRFNNIRLVDSFTNEAASHGYISFKISQQPNNEFGTIIENRAGIYFDFNPPVITNTTHHEVGEVITVVPALEIAGQPAPTVYPNPVSSGSMLQLKGDGFPAGHYTVIDMNGRICQDGILANNRIALSNLKTGNYTIRIQAVSGEWYVAKVSVQ